MSYAKRSWRRVVHACECDEDGNCPVCGIDFADCDCPGPTQDEYEYRDGPDGLEARLISPSNTETKTKRKKKHVNTNI